VFNIHISLPPYKTPVQLHEHWHNYGKRTSPQSRNIPHNGHSGYQLVLRRYTRLPDIKFNVSEIYELVLKYLPVIKRNRAGSLCVQSVTQAAARQCTALLRKPQGVMSQETGWYHHVVTGHCIVSPRCCRKLHVIVMLVQETACYLQAGTGNCMVSSCWYRKLHVIFMMVQETACYLHAGTGNCMLSSCWYRKLHSIVMLFLKLDGIVILLQEAASYHHAAA
jgi:hypothetical protein